MLLHAGCGGGSAKYWRWLPAGSTPGKSSSVNNSEQNYIMISNGSKIFSDCFGLANSKNLKSQRDPMTMLVVQDPLGQDILACFGDSAKQIADIYIYIYKYTVYRYMIYIYIYIYLFKKFKSANTPLKLTQVNMLVLSPTHVQNMVPCREFTSVRC